MEHNQFDFGSEGMNREPFRGSLKKLKLISMQTGFGVKPEGETEQHLTMSRGTVTVSSYGLGPEGKADRILTARKLSVDAHTCSLIFAAVEGCFRQPLDFPWIADTGIWKLELTNTQDQVFYFFGSLGARMDFQGVSLSGLIRNGLELEDLWVFDLPGQRDRIESITVEYRRVMKIDGGELGELNLWEYSEQVDVDREQETIQLTQNVSGGCRITHTYQVEGGVSTLLDSLDPDTVFSELPPQPADLLPIPNESRSYRITLRRIKGGNRVLEGSYDSCGLPTDYRDFAGKIMEFIRFYGVCEMLAPNVYDLNRRRRSDYIFCSVEFPYGSQRYYYLAEEDIYKVGDKVIVPAGKDNHPAEVTIAEIQYFSEETVPMPIHKVKYILRKAGEEDHE